jgi:D-alanyl-D-alanine carboxypeptidase
VVAAVAGGVLALALAACGGADADPAGPGTDRTGAVPTTPAVSTATATDHAVDPPGRLTGARYYADLLVVSKHDLPASVVERIRRLRDVAAVEPIGLSQVTLENRAVNVAVVDPAGYRRFTPDASATLQEAWDRVAGGEVAVTPELAQRLGKDADELTLGSSAAAPTLHIGAYAPQVEQVDAVVNRSWGADLGMPESNALLVNTGLAAPVSLRGPIERIVGDDASVQRQDTAARYGLDTSVQQTAVFTGGGIAEAVGTFNYTVLGGGRIAPEPSWVASHISTRTMPIIGPMTCNTAIFPQLEAALKEVQARGLADELHPSEYAGCYVPRFIAGTTTLSNHSFGLAMDFNVPGNQRGTVGEMDRGVVSIFEKWGFTWGGTWRYTDPMHFELAALVAVR